VTPSASCAVSNRRRAISVVALLVVVISAGCSLPAAHYWDIPANRTTQDFERDHRVCYADAHFVTLGFFSPAEMDQAYVHCLAVLGWKPTEGGAESACRGRYSEPRPHCQLSVK
jgi:hypothetical protein